MKPFLNQIIPFIKLGIGLTFIVIALFFLSYVFVLGTLIGLLLFAVFSIAKYFEAKKKSVKPNTKGRIIDSNDYRKL